jgi:hypothetical protein
MIVAEHCALIRKSQYTDKGGLAHSRGSFYNEVKIINYLGEDITALDYKNDKVVFKPEGAVIPADERNLIIQYRSTRSPRVIGNLGLETSVSEFGTMTIPYDLLLQEPIFVEEINALLFSPVWHPTAMLHPHSKEYNDLQNDKLRNEISRDAVYSPITIMANDPQGKIKQLYIALNDKICTVKVTNCNAGLYETDVVAISIRGSINGALDDRKIIRTSFTELMRKNPLFWEIEGFCISTDRTWLENKLAVEKTKPSSNGIPVEEVQALLKQARDGDKVIIDEQAAEIVQLGKDVKAWKQRYTELKSSYDDIVSGGYLDRNSTVAFKKIDLEETKLNNAEKQSKRDQKIEDIKLTKEQLGTIANIAKAAAVIIPAVVSLVVLYQKVQQKK